MKASLADWWRQQCHNKPVGRLFLRQRHERDIIGGVN